VVGTAAKVAGRCTIVTLSIAASRPSPPSPHPINPSRRRDHPATMAGVQHVEIVVAHQERTTLRVGDVFLKIDAEWLIGNDVLPADVVRRNRRIAEAALRPWTPVFTHGDLQIAHVFVDRDEITGVIDWSEAGPGDALYDLAILTLGHEEHLADVVAGYGAEVDLDVIHAWWSLRSLLAIRWLVEHGFDPSAPGCEIDVLRARN
jgi:hypothetical protein